MKRILCLTENLGSGGAERQLTGLAVLLKQKGYHVKVITYIEKQFYEPYLLENNIDYEFVKKASNKYTRIYYLYKAFKYYKPDVVISYLPSVNISVCLTRFWYKYKLIVSERSSTRKVSLKDKFKFWLYKNANYVVANSYHETERIAELFPFLRSKLYTITNYIDTAKFRPSKNMQPKNGSIKIITVARIIPMKNIQNYLYGIRMILDKGYAINAIWIGENRNHEYYNECIGLIKTLGIESNFTFKTQTNMIAEEYQKADIFCLPSYYEGYPNVICEAMSCGLPIVCSNVCDNPRIVVDDVNGFLFDPSCIESIADSIIKMITSENFVQMKLRNREFATIQFNGTKFCNKYINLIE